MILPSKLRLRARSPWPAPLSGIIFGMKITSGYKNPYFIYFPKTDGEGRTSLSPEAIRGQYEDHWDAALMDYSGTLEDARQWVGFFLFDLRKIFLSVEGARKSRLLKYERSQWKSREEHVNYVLSSRNSSFLFWAPPLPVPTTEREVNLWVVPLPWSRAFTPECRPTSGST